MSKNKKGNGFKNPLAELLKEPQRIILFDEDRIYREMNKDFDTVLDQMKRHLRGYEVQDQNNAKKTFTKKDKEPRYFLNAFHNVSFLRYIQEWIDENKGEITEADKNSISHYVAMGFKDSRMYPEVDKDLRDEMLLDIFYTLQKKRVKNVRNLVKRKEKAIEIAMYTMLQPLYTARNVITLLEKHSADSNKDKRKLLQKLYGKKRFYEFIGYCMTNDFKDNKLLTKLIKFALDESVKEQRKYLREYARAFKKILRYNNLLADFKADKKKNRKLMKQLVKDDLGFKKAFRFGKKKKRRDQEELRFVPDVAPSYQRNNSYNDRNNSYDNRNSNNWRDDRNADKRRDNYRR